VDVGEGREGCEMKTIWKFQLTSQWVSIPVGAKILSAQLQRGVPTIWAIVDPTAERIQRQFNILSTGSEFTLEFLGGSSYIATFQDEDGIECHLFEIL
jgi:hypothetical protein